MLLLSMHLFGAQVACPAAEIESDSTSGVRRDDNSVVEEEMDASRTSICSAVAACFVPLLAMPVQDHPEHDLPVAKVLHGIICHSMVSRFTCKGVGLIGLFPFIHWCRSMPA